MQTQTRREGRSKAWLTKVKTPGEPTDKPQGERECNHNEPNPKHLCDNHMHLTSTFCKVNFRANDPNNIIRHASMETNEHMLHVCICHNYFCQCWINVKNKDIDLKRSWRLLPWSHRYSHGVNSLEMFKTDGNHINCQVLQLDVWFKQQICINIGISDENVKAPRIQCFHWWV